MNQATPATGGSASVDALSVRVGARHLALPLSRVAEVVRPLPAVRVPHAPAPLLGLAALHGAVLPVMSLALLLGQEQASASPDARVVVLDGAPRFGLLVDAVGAIGPAEAAAELPDLLPILARWFPPPQAAPLPPATGGHADAAAHRDGDTPHRSLLCFALGTQRFALPIEAVQAVRALPAETGAALLPGTDAAMLGAVALPDRLLPLLSPRALLGLPEAADRRPRPGSRAVVVRIGEHPVALAVDGGTELLRVPEAAIEPVPPPLLRADTEARTVGLIRGGTGRLIQLLSPARLLDEATTRRLARHDVAAADREGSDRPATGGNAAADGGEPVLVLLLGRERYGLPVAVVDEVARHPGALARAPHAPDGLAGVMILRGAALPVIDARQQFGVSGEPAARSAQRVVAARVDGVRFGLAVDGVASLARLPRQRISPAPVCPGGAIPFRRVARPEQDPDRVLLLIDPPALLDGVRRALPASSSMAAATTPTGAATP